MENVIEPLERSGFLDRNQIVRLFDNTNYRTVAFRISAVHARVNIRQIVADGAEYDLLLDLQERTYKILNLRLRTAHYIKSQPLR